MSTRVPKRMVEVAPATAPMTATGSAKGSWAVIRYEPSAV